MQGPNNVPHSTNDRIIVSWLVANSPPNFQLNVNLPQELLAPSEVRFPKKYSEAEICGKSYLKNTSGINSRRVKESGLGRRTCSHSKAYTWSREEFWSWGKLTELLT